MQKVREESAKRSHAPFVFGGEFREDFELEVGGKGTSDFVAESFAKFFGFSLEVGPGDSGKRKLRPNVRLEDFPFFFT